jgi:hypothetical protein
MGHTEVKCKKRGGRWGAVSPVNMGRLSFLTKRAPAQGNTFAQQVLNQRTPCIGNEMLFGTGHKLAAACFALMMLFPTVHMAVLLELWRSTPWARVSADHGYCWPP